MTFSASLVQRHQDVHSRSSRLGVQPRHCHKPSVCGRCVISSHTQTHTLTHTTHPCAHPPLRALSIMPTRHSAPPPSILCIYTLNSTSAAHTRKVHGTFCVAPVLVFSSSSAVCLCQRPAAQPDSPPSSRPGPPSLSWSWP